MAHAIAKSFVVAVKPQNKAKKLTDGEREYCAALRMIGDVDGGVVFAGKVANDGQAEPEAGDAGIGGIPAAQERLEDFVPDIGGDALPFVADGEFAGVVGRFLKRDVDCAWTAVREGVADEVGGGVDVIVGIDADFWQVVVDLEIDPAVVFGIDGEGAHGVVQDGA